ncbi:MAG: hypothetical protein ABII99_02980 [Patescibacteria group bacterium]|nr:hypothetical protein [Patescibacteria group bacterium]MBU1160627.1 hypothetical protein [Patescibacteria group bacterium]MBU1350087.1 hypothetical protein [Patescibacteria group bacterium]MBU1421266.1 hypothetical protein [Patescibacteria group bacterium]MBU1778149.1 hypothetical protein [Patescibacteria group bacterium]
MAYFHKNLTQEKWNNFSKDQQILNIASELSRAKNWIKKQDKNYTQNSLDRAFELIDLTINDNKWRNSSLKELLRLREMLGEFYIGLNKNINELIKLIKILLKFNKLTAGVIVS